MGRACLLDLILGYVGCMVGSLAQLWATGNSKFALF